MSTEARRLGKYELRERLAAGGMGEVWKALDPQLRRYVAIKLLHADLRDDPDFTTRFKREAQLVAALRHPNIVQIHDFDFALEEGSKSMTGYMVMDYIPGQTLADYIRATSRKFQFPPAGDIVYLFTAIGLGLDYAHKQGVIHRDIKPANILLDRRLATAKPMGEPVLTDFGIARQQQGGASLTIKGALLGTPHYISPEQAQGEPGDHRSDLYSLGVVLYEIMTGVTPFRGDTLPAILMQHMIAAPTPPALINPAITSEVSDVILTSLAKEPDGRFSSASAMTTALAEALDVPIPTQLLRPLAPSEDTYIPTYSTYPQMNASAGIMPISSPSFSPSTPPFNINTPSSPMSPPYSAQGAPPAVSTSSPVAATAKKPGRKPLYIGLSLLLIGVLLAAGLGISIVSRPSTSSSTPTAAVVVGHLTFVRSQHAAPGAFDELRINLADIPDPGAGQGYYAWLESPCAGAEIQGPHWPLPMSNNAIHTPPMSYQGYNNLFCPSSHSLLVVSKESTSPPPIVATTRLYYAHITQKSIATFEIVPCPASGTSNVCESG